MLLLVAGLLGLLACTGTRNASRSSSKAYVQYYRNDSTNLYFLKPFKLKEEVGDNYGTIDFTFEAIADSVNQVRANFSLFLLEKQSLTSFELGGANWRNPLTSPNPMFREVHKKYFHYRYTASLPYRELKRWIATPSPRMIIGSESGNPLVLSPSSPSQKNILSLQQDFFGFVVP
jgi:hypothetical protein